MIVLPYSSLRSRWIDDGNKNIACIILMCISTFQKNMKIFFLVVNPVSSMVCNLWWDLMSYFQQVKKYVHIIMKMILNFKMSFLFRFSIIHTKISGFFLRKIILVILASTNGLSLMESFYFITIHIKRQICYRKSFSKEL